MWWRKMNYHIIFGTLSLKKMDGGGGVMVARLQRTQRNKHAKALKRLKWLIVLTSVSHIQEKSWSRVSQDAPGSEVHALITFNGLFIGSLIGWYSSVSYVSGIKLKVSVQNPDWSIKSPHEKRFKPVVKLAELSFFVQQRFDWGLSEAGWKYSPVFSVATFGSDAAQDQN